MTSGTPEVLEHRTTRGGRWLRERRIRLALWIALIEGLLIVVDAIPWTLAIVVAVAIVVGYFMLRDRVGPDTARQAFWVAAASQAIVATVPVVLAVATVAALIVLALIGVAALLVLLGDRR
jgi:hypothetical protein